MREIVLLQSRFTLPDLMQPFMSGVWLRPVAAYDAARTLYNGKIKYDLVIHNPNFCLTFWTIHTYLPIKVEFTVSNQRLQQCAMF